MSGLPDLRMVGQAKIVVRGEHDALAPTDEDVPALLPFERDLILEGLGRLEAVELPLELLVELIRSHAVAAST